MSSPRPSASLRTESVESEFEEVAMAVPSAFGISTGTVAGVDDTQYAPNSMNQPLLNASAPHAEPSRHGFTLPPWTLECACWAGSCGCYVAAVLFLYYLHGHKEQSIRHFGITVSINSILAAIITIGELLLAIPTTAAVGQLKWLHVAEQRGLLHNFTRLDNASRGTWGSLMLLISRQGGLTALSGAGLIVLAVASHFVAQLSIHIGPGYKITPNASVLPVADYFYSTGKSRFPIDDAGYDTLNYMDLNMIPAIYQALYTSDTAEPVIKSNCTTANCSWTQPYSTLAICSSCANLTASVTSTFTSHVTASDYSYQDYTYELPNGLKLAGYQVNKNGTLLGPPLLNVSAVVRSSTLKFKHAPARASPQLNTSVMYADASSVLLDIAVIGLSPSGYPMQPRNQEFNITAPQAQPVAWECILQVCLLEMTGKLINGDLSENFSDVHTSSYSTNGTWYFDSTTGHTLKANVETVGTVGAWMTALLQGSAYLANDADPDPDSSTMDRLVQLMNQSENGFPDLINRTANQMTLALRQTANQSQAIFGTSSQAITDIRIRPLWMIYPLSLLLGGLVLLIMVILQSNRRNRPVWTTNILPVLFHGLERFPTLAENDLLRQASDMQRAADGIYVHLGPAEGVEGHRECLQVYENAVDKS